MVGGNPTSPILFNEVNAMLLLQYSVGKWREEDMEYLNGYGIDSGQLMKDRVLPLSEYTIAARKKVQVMDGVYAVTMEGDGASAIWGRDERMKPFGTAGYGSYRPMGNKGSMAIVVGSYLDARVLANAGYMAVWMPMLDSRYENIYDSKKVGFEDTALEAVGMVEKVLVVYSYGIDRELWQETLGRVRPTRMVMAGSIAVVYRNERNDGVKREVERWVK